MTSAQVPQMSDTDTSGLLQDFVHSDDNNSQSGYSVFTRYSLGYSLFSRAIRYSLKLLGIHSGYSEFTRPTYSFRLPGNPVYSMFTLPSLVFTRATRCSLDLLDIHSGYDTHSGYALSLWLLDIHSGYEIFTRATRYSLGLRDIH